MWFEDEVWRLHRLGGLNPPATFVKIDLEDQIRVASDPEIPRTLRKQVKSKSLIRLFKNGQWGPHLKNPDAADSAERN